LGARRYQEAVTGDSAGDAEAARGDQGSRVDERRDQGEMVVVGDQLTTISP